MLMEKLGLEVPEFRLRRSLILKTVRKEDGQVDVRERGRREGRKYHFTVTCFCAGDSVWCRQSWQPILLPVPGKCVCVCVCV